MERHFSISFQDSENLNVIFHDQEVFGVSKQEVVQIYENDYEKLRNKPAIESHELVGNKSFADLGMKRMTNWDIERIILLNP